MHMGRTRHRVVPAAPGRGRRARIEVGKKHFRCGRSRSGGTALDLGAGTLSSDFAGSPEKIEQEKTLMANIATALKSEISRIARKEVRAETQQLKKQSAHYRSQIAALKRQVAALDKQVRRTAHGGKAVSAAPEVDDFGAGGLRFRAKGFATHRRRLGLSAAQAGALLGVSGQSIYHWETGKARPRASQMPAIAALRKLNKTQAAAAVAQVLG